MDTHILAALIAGIAAVSGAALGGLFPWLTQRDQKARERDSKWISKLENELRARIALEEDAVAWIVELQNKGEKGARVKVQLRDRTEARTALRPEMSWSDLRGRRD